MAVKRLIRGAEVGIPVYDLSIVFGKLAAFDREIDTVLKVNSNHVRRLQRCVNGSTSDTDVKIELYVCFWGCFVDKL